MCTLKWPCSSPARMYSTNGLSATEPIDRDSKVSQLSRWLIQKYRFCWALSVLFVSVQFRCPIDSASRMTSYKATSKHEALNEVAVGIHRIYCRSMQAGLIIGEFKTHFTNNQFYRVCPLSCVFAWPDTYSIGELNPLKPTEPSGMHTMQSDTSPNTQSISLHSSLWSDQPIGFLLPNRWT